ncbi:MAG: FtsX-like permease family protein [Lachnospiraceae bacterium]|nr:FtsX-like permease family protein [Lachnospiraceae bacterium]
MNLCKRACLYSIRKKGKTLTLLAFLLVMATLMLTCLSIRSATETANTNIKKALLGYFTINAKHLDTGIPEAVTKQILSMDGLSGGYTLRSYTYATYLDTQGNPLEINTEDAAQIPDGYENAGRLVANTKSENDSYFTEGGFTLTEGSHIVTETGKQVLIHEKFAKRNGLSIGDTLLLRGIEDQTHTIPVTVAGIFINTKEQDSIGLAPSCDLYDNIMFTDLATASFLLYGTEGETRVQYGDFYVNDPDDLEQIMAEVQGIDSMDWANCTLTRYDNDYQNAKESLAGLQNIVFIAIAVVSLICFLVLALFLTLRLRGRIHETGVYLAMGISKGSVLMQYLLEVVIAAVLALLLSFGASSAISHQIGSSLLSQVTSEAYETVSLTGDAESAEKSSEDLGLSEIEVAVSAKDYALVWAFGMVLCAASTALAAYPIMKMKPRNILSQMS